MKKTLITFLTASLITAGIPAVAHASIEDSLPACVLYDTHYDIPVSFHCEPYMLPNGMMTNAISINEK